MEREKVERINKFYNWVRVIILVLFVIFVMMGLLHT